MVDWGCVELGWLAYCNTDGLRYSGYYTADFVSSYPWYVFVEATFNCLVQLTSPTRLVAGRDVNGFMLANYEHSVQLTYPDESNEVLLGPDWLVTEVERLLTPGNYRVSITVFASHHGYHPLDYNASVQVDWETNVALPALTWGAVKSLYH
jgi:hypothetical protein